MTANTIRNFIAQYNNCLGMLSKANPTRLFWATDFASKNRFSCPLPDILEARVSGQPIPSVEDKHLKRMLGMAVYAWQAWQKARQSRFLLKRLIKGQKYQAVRTYFYDHSFDAQGKYKDAFLGRLPDVLNRQEPVVIIGYVLGDFKIFCQKAKDTEIVVLPVEAFLTLGDILQAWWDVVTVPVRVPREVMFMDDNIAPLIEQVLHHTFKGVKFDQYVQFYAIRRFARQHELTRFFMTCENYPWERMTIMALRGESPKTKIIGIQHTVVPQAFLNYAISCVETGQDLIADIIYTTGEATAKIMREISTVPVPVQAGGAWRFEHFSDIVLEPARRPVKRILLALEGSLQAAHLVKYVFEQWPSLNGIELRIRTHPLVSWDAFACHLGVILQPGMDISKGSLKEDLLWADATMYWSTTVSMEALMMGKPVIHVPKKGILSFDPLFDCPYLKWTAEGDLKDILNLIDQCPDAMFKEAQQKARAYLMKYFGRPEIVLT